MAYFNNNGMEYVKGPNNTLYIKIDNFLYKRVNGKFPLTKWECIYNKKPHYCDAFVKTNRWIYSEKYVVHDHPSHNAKILRDEAMEVMREKVKDDLITPVQTIVRSVRTTYSLRLRGTLPLPKEATLCDSLRKLRRSQFPPTPETLEGIEIDGRWRLDAYRRETFLQIDDGTTDRILGFFTKSALKILCKSVRVIADGTFKVRPVIFAQLYVFHAEVFGKYFPCLFFLLPDKSEKTYVRVLKLIQKKAQQYGFSFTPGVFQLDYEKAMINAVESVLPQSKIQGCLFHYTQCIWRKIQNLGLVEEYKNIQEVHTYFRRFSALPLLPESALDESWYYEFAENWPNQLDENRARKFLNYMVETWLDEDDAIYKRSWWNHFENRGPRTTNNAEGWHRKLNKTAGNRHLGLFPFIRILHIIQLDWECDFDDLISSKDKAKRLKYVRIDERIENAKIRFINDAIDELKFLDDVSNSLHLE